MAAAATVMAVFEEEMGPRRPSRPDIEETGRVSETDSRFANWSSKDIGIYAINATLKLAQEVSRLSSTVERLDAQLKHEYTDTKTLELRTLRTRDKWLKGLVTAVVTTVVIAEVVRWLGLPGGH